jgi:putative peptidoglycan lipid II flippase
MKKVNVSIAGASIILSGFSVFSKGVGFIREIMFARNFGLSSEFDLFLTCAALPTVINTSVIYLGQHYFIPAYNKLNNQSESKGDEFLNYTFWLFISGGLFIALLLLILSKLFVGFYLSNISPEVQVRGRQIFLLFLITIPVNSGFSIITAYMQAKFNFIYPAISQLILNIVIIILVFFLTSYFKIFILPVSFIIAYYFAFFILIKPVFKKLDFKIKLIFRNKYELLNLKNLLFLIVIESLSLSYILIDRYFIGKIPTGGLAALNYANVIYSLPISIFSISLITTMFSKFSHSSIRSDNQLENDFNNAISINSYVIIPIMFLLYFWGDIFLKIFYERGAFSAADTLQTHKALQFYVVSLVFYSAYLIAVKLFYSINRYAVIMYLSIAAFFLKILFNYLLVNKLDQNGLALSTSLIYLFLFIMAFYYAVRQINMHNYLSSYLSIVYFLLNGSLSYTVMRLSFVFINGKGLGIKAGEIVVFLLIYLFNSFYLDNYESKILKNSFSTLLKGIMEKIS